MNFVDDTFELKSHCLQALYFPKDHTEENIALSMKEALAASDLSEEHQVAITTDNSTGIDKAVLKPFISFF